MPPADPPAATGDIPAVVLLRRDEAEAMVRASEANGGCRWSDDGVEAAWELTHGHPYLLQHLSWHVGQRMRPRVEASEQTTKRCAACGQTSPEESEACTRCGSPDWYHVKRDRPAASREDVDAVVQATLAASRSSLERLWKELQPTMRAVLWSVAKAGPETMPEEHLRRMFAARRMVEAARDPAKASVSAEGWDLLEAAGGGYRLRGDLLRRWIAALDPPEGALELAEEAQTTPGKQDGTGGEDAAGKPEGAAARTPEIAAAPETQGAASDGKRAAAKRRPGRSVAPWAGAAALLVMGALVGWLARGGSTPAATPGTSAPPATGGGAAPVEAPAAEDDGSNLPPGRGYLVVDAPVESGVFAFGTFIGLTGRRLEVSCGSKFLRLGVPPADGSTQPARIVWTSPGKSAQVACKAVTRVSLTPTK